MADTLYTMLVKGNERYVLLYDEAGIDDALRTLFHWATDKDLSFTTDDMAQMAKRVKANKRVRTAPAPQFRSRM